MGVAWGLLVAVEVDGGLVCFGGVVVLVPGRHFRCVHVPLESCGACIPWVGYTPTHAHKTGAGLTALDGDGERERRGSGEIPKKKKNLTKKSEGKET